MTVTGKSNDDPEINLWAEPSAPPLPATASIPVASALHAPVSTPVATPLGKPAAQPAAQSSAASNGNRTIEKTANPDGSLSVKVTTTNTLSNGSREITIEYFQIPAHMASSASAGIDAGEPPSGLYLTKMEQQTLPPGTSQVPGSASPHPAAAYPMAGNAAPLQQPTSQHATPFEQPGDRRGSKAMAICIAIFVIVTALVIGNLVVSNSSHHASSPSWHYPTPPSPTPWSPTPWSPTPWSSPSWPSPRPTWNPTLSPTVSSGPTVSPRPTASPTASPPPTTSFMPTTEMQSIGYHKYRLVGRGECTNADGKTTYTRDIYSGFGSSPSLCELRCGMDFSYDIDSISKRNERRFVGFQLSTSSSAGCTCLFDPGNLVGPITRSTGVGDTECYRIQSSSQKGVSKS